MAPGISRRQFLESSTVICAGLVLDRGVLAETAKGKPMTITCVIRYQIDPFQKQAFKKYAENWGRIIPCCDGHLIGYFLPYEGTNDIGWGLIAFDSLASYERYKAKLKTDAEAMENFAMAAEEPLHPA